jgi:hypothetical protein
LPGEQSVLAFLNQQEPLLLVLGDKGSGKSQLVHNLNHKQLLASDTLYLKGKSGISPAKLVKTLTSYWHITVQNTQASKQQLDDILLTLAQRTAPACLIIDDADALPIATLAAIMHLTLNQNSERLGLRILLLGRPTLENKLDNLHHPDVVIACIKLKGPRRSQNTASRTQPARAPLLQARTMNDWFARHWIKFASLAMLTFTFFGIHQYQQKMRHLGQLANYNAKPLSTDDNKAALPSLAHYLPPVAAQTQPSNGETPLSLPKKQYVIQLMASHNKVQLLRIQQSQHLESDSWITSAKRQGQTWYTLNYGHFDSVTEAKRALNQLPLPLKSQHPWVRSQHV